MKREGVITFAFVLAVIMLGSLSIASFATSPSTKNIVEDVSTVFNISVNNSETTEL